MPIDTQIPGSPGWWFNKLLTDLEGRRWRLDKLDAYYRGDCDLPESAEGAREAYRRFQSKARSNFAQLIVDATRERMSVVGFRTGAEGDEESDGEAWRIWQGNGMDEESGLLHQASLTMGDAYGIVGGVDPETGVPLITAEDPRQVITAHDPQRRRRTVAALKVFEDELSGLDAAVLFLPGVVWRAVRRRASSQRLSGWDWDGDPEGLPFPVVPVVRFGNRADLFGRTQGEFEGALDTLDRINHMLLQRLVIATIQAFRQRVIKADLPPTDPEGNPIDYNGLFSPAPGAMWVIPPDADIWESQQTDLTGILSAVRHDIQDLAASTRTPLFYLTPDAANGSAEGASLAREGLVFKTRDRLVAAGESWEQVMRLAFLFSGQGDHARSDMEVLWAPPERFSLSERYDAASKAQTAGVPWSTVMQSVLQFSPQEVQRLAAERFMDLQMSPAFGVPEVEPVPVTGGA